MIRGPDISNGKQNPEILTQLLFSKPRDNRSSALKDIVAARWTR